MPKDNKAARELKKQRLEKAEKMKHLLSKPSGKVSIDVIGNGCRGSPGVLSLSTDHQRYLFNCGEETQRVTIESSLRVGKIRHVFLTQANWKNMGGLPGLSMTLQGIGIPDITVHSPKDILPLYSITKRFSVSSELNVDGKTIADGSFCDQDVEILYAPIQRKVATCQNGNPDPLKAEDVQTTVMCYVCRLKQLPGALNIMKCIELKVPRGPALNDLKNGKDFVFPDGRVVRSVDVVEPPEPSPMFMVIDCPSEDYLDSLENQPVLSKFIHSTEEKDTLSHVIHFTPTRILESHRYKDWLASFPPATTHLVINNGNTIKSYVAPYTLQSKLRLLDQQLFPCLYEEEWKDIENCKVIRCPTRLSTQIRPKNQDKDAMFNTSDCPLLCDPNVVTEELFLQIPEMREALEKYREKLFLLEEQQKQNPSHQALNEYPIINFLGTASAMPGKERNTSFILIKVNESSSIIFDCGEGSYGQMVRYFGPDKADEELEKVKAIFVSHLHADHHLGLISLLVRRGELNLPPLMLILPAAVHNWLYDYHRLYEPIRHTYVCKQTENFMSGTVFDKQLIDDLALRSLQTVRVRHCRDSFGISIVTKENKFKIVYSGDAMPSPYLAVVGKDCDLLIHEATMEDELLDEAVLKRHSTTSQAIEMGRKMNAKNIILTHFSQRYAKIPVIDEEEFVEARVGIAFDNMKVTPKDFDRLRLLLEPLRVMFSLHEQENQLRIAKKHLRERILSSMKMSLEADDDENDQQVKKQQDNRAA